MNYKNLIVAATIISLILLSGCSVPESDNQSNSSESQSSDTVSYVTEALDTSDMFSNRDLNVNYDTAEAKTIVLNNETTTIAGEGTYIVSGNIENGQIIVDASSDDKIQLVLNGVNITSSTSAPIYIKQADKVFITLADGSDNTLQNSVGFVADGDTNVDGVIFSKDDLTLNGTGKLMINSSDHGIVSKDDLIITGGEYAVHSEAHALSGKDALKVAGGSFNIESGKDGFHAENTDDAALGYVYIKDCNVTASCEGDGIAASGRLQIDGGNFDIKTGGGAVNAEKQIEGFGRFPGYNTGTTETDSVSSKGIKASGSLVIKGGVYNIDSSDDAVHSNTNAEILGGEFNIKTGDDGFHADSALYVSDGKIVVLESYEALEGQTIEIIGGNLDVTSSDDGLNAAGGNDQSGFGGFGGNMRPDAFASDSNSWIKIRGGILHVNASGDGIDSNGALYVSGGETYVSGPTNSGNGALDYGSSAEITGGKFIAVGAVGMSAGFTSATQGAVMITAQGGADVPITVNNSKGEEIFSYTPKKNYSSIVLSHPEIEKGEKYRVTVGSDNYDIEMTDIIYGSSQGGMGGHGGFGGDKGGFGKDPGNGMQRPVKPGF